MADLDEREEHGSGDADPGLVGGGGPAETIDDLPGADDEDRHRADGDHDEL